MPVKPNPKMDQKNQSSVTLLNGLMTLVNVFVFVAFLILNGYVASTTKGSNQPPLTSEYCRTDTESLNTAMKYRDEHAKLASLQEQLNAEKEERNKHDSDIEKHIGTLKQTIQDITLEQKKMNNTVSTFIENKGSNQPPLTSEYCRTDTESLNTAMKYRDEHAKLASLQEQLNAEKEERNKHDSDIEKHIGTLKQTFQDITLEQKKMNNTVSTFIENKERKVAFSVGFNEGNKTVYEKNQTLLFKYFFYSHGGGYDNSTGIFTAPKSGTYLFVFSVESLPEGVAQLVFMVRGIIKSSAISAAAGRITAGNACIEYLSKGDQAWMRTAKNENKYDINLKRTTFSGIMID